jgi:hypothetical protein
MARLLNRQPPDRWRRALGRDDLDHGRQLIHERHDGLNVRQLGGLLDGLILGFGLVVLGVAGGIHGIYFAST